MRIRAERDVVESIRTTEAFFIGDVRDVIHSRAGRGVAVPALFDGLGACGTDDPATAGESIIFRGHAARTQPDSEAGLTIDYRTSTEGFYTPFLIGWNGRHSFTMRFTSEAGVTLHQLHRHIFSELRASALSEPPAFIFLELVGFFKPADIFDRALCKPVDRGNVLTTSAEHAAEFFRPRIIYNDLIARRAPPEDLFPLCVVGIGCPGDDSDAGAASLRETIFYRPPQTGTPAPEGDAPGRAAAQVMTHNHALGWFGASGLAEYLRSVTQPSSRPEDEARMGDESLVEEVLKRRPDYLVHLDDWSILRAATVKIYLAAADRFNIQSVAGDRR